MKKMRCIAGLLSAVLLVSVPGVFETASALDAVHSPSASVVSETHTTTSSYQVTVTANSLNIRKKADKSSDITGLLKKGDTCTIVDEQTDSRGVVWGKLESGKGWINLNFTKKSSSSFSKYNVKVTANSLNIRQKADKNSDITGVLTKGTVCTIVAEQKDSRGVTWGKLESGKGWISLSYAQKTDGSTSVTSYNVKVTAYSLNIRKKADKTSAVTGVLQKGDICTIVAEQKDSRGVTWGKLDNGKGWISLSYAQKTDGTPSFAKYNVKVTADSLYIRSKADKTSAINGVLKKGAVCTIVAEQKDSRGVTWGKLESGKGWISLSYAKKTTDSVTSFTQYTVAVTASSLNIRKSPDGTSAITGSLKKGNICTIVAEQKDSRGLKWGKLDNGKGWICLKYCEKA